MLSSIFSQRPRRRNARTIAIQHLEARVALSGVNVMATASADMMMDEMYGPTEPVMSEAMMPSTESDMSGMESEMAMMEAMAMNDLMTTAESAVVDLTQITPENRVVLSDLFAQGQPVVSARSASFTANSAPASQGELPQICLLYTSPSPRDQRGSRMPSSA